MNGRGTGTAPSGEGPARAPSPAWNPDGGWKPRPRAAPAAGAAGEATARETAPGPPRGDDSPSGSSPASGSSSIGDGTASESVSCAGWHAVDYALLGEVSLSAADFGSSSGDGTATALPAVCARNAAIDLSFVASPHVTATTCAVGRTAMGLQDRCGLLQDRSLLARPPPALLQSHKDA